jgi:hypothetical protein
MNLIKVCRTAAPGGHLTDASTAACMKGLLQLLPQPHCPAPNRGQEQWLDARRAELCPADTFTWSLPPTELNPIILGNKEKLLGLLFSTVNHVLRCFARDPQWRLVGKIGYLAVLHTWSQTLLDHFHLHCLVPAGVLSFSEQKWVKARKTYLFRNQSLAKAIKHRYIQQLRRLYQDGQLHFVDKTRGLASPASFGQLVHALNKKDWSYMLGARAAPSRCWSISAATHRGYPNHRILGLKIRSPSPWGPQRWRQAQATRQPPSSSALLL